MDWERSTKLAKACGGKRSKLCGCTRLLAKTDRWRHRRFSAKSTNLVKAPRSITKQQPIGIGFPPHRAMLNPRRDWERCCLEERELSETRLRLSNGGHGPRSGEIQKRNAVSHRCIGKAQEFRVTLPRRIRCLLLPEKRMT